MQPLFFFRSKGKWLYGSQEDIHACNLVYSSLSNRKMSTRKWALFSHSLKWNTRVNWEKSNMEMAFKCSRPQPRNKIRGPNQEAQWTHLTGSAACRHCSSPELAWPSVLIKISRLEPQRQNQGIIPEPAVLSHRQAQNPWPFTALISPGLAH